MTATYCVSGRWYHIEQATKVGGDYDAKEPARPFLWSGWIYVLEKKYHTEHTVTLIGLTSNMKKHLVLEMRRGLTVKTLKNGPPVYIIHELTL